MLAIRTCALGAALLGLALAATADAGPYLSREFRYPAGRVRLARTGAFTRIRVTGAVPERRAGRPDLPRVGERVEIPEGHRVERVEVTALETEPLAGEVRVAPAVRLEAGESGAALTAPDPAFYERAGFQPEPPVEIGYQGMQRDRNSAWLLVTPVRWDAASGRLERVARLAVRLVLTPSGERPVPRQRVVPEWEASAPAASRAVAARAVAAASPEPGTAQPFRATQLPSVLGSPVAYLIVTGDALAAEFQALAEWKTQCGLPAVVRTTGFIRQQYPFAADDAERIRMFIRDAYGRWGTRWVLLGGDTEVIPERIARTTAYGGENIPSDMYYGCLDGSWNADGDSLWGEGYVNASAPGDSADLLPEVWVGRAPVTTAADVELFVNKTLTYEMLPVGDYMRDVLFFAEVLFPQYWTPGQSTILDGAELVEYDLLPILDTVPWIHHARLYENYTDARWRPGSLRETRAVVLDSLERGYNISVHIGHGYRTVASVGDANLDNNDAFDLANGNRLTNLYATNCTSNAIDFQSLGEAFVRAPNGGAVTNIGSTRFDFPAIGRDYQQEYFRLIYEDSVSAIGEAQARQKFPLVGAAFYDGLDRWTQLTMLLLGDPELRIFTNTPRLLLVGAPSTVPVSDSSFNVSVTTDGAPLEGARVTAYMPGREFRTGTTGAGGNLTLPFRPDTLGAFVLTVTAFNGRPYRKNITVVASGEAALAGQPPVVVDDSLSGRHGNGDGRLDAGELLDLRVAVRNSGGAPAPDVTGTLSTTDGLVTIPLAEVSYGTIGAGALSDPAAGYRVSVPFDCPDQREVPFRLDLVSGDGRHWESDFTRVVHAPELAHVAHVESEPVGNGNGWPEAGETVSYAFRIRNLGTGAAAGLYGRLRNHDGLATVLDSAFTVAALAAGAETTASPASFAPQNAAAKLELLLFDSYGQRLSQTLDLGYPDAVPAPHAVGGAGWVRLTWPQGGASDLAGYHVYRSSSAGGPYAKVNAVPTGRAAWFEDAGVPPLTRYWYKLAAVDSSGNESALSPAASASTNPALHPGFPALIHHSSPAPVAVDHVYPGYPQEILAGAGVLYLLHPDGTAPVDADGSGVTTGDFTTEGSFYAGGGSISDLDGDGLKEIIGAAWDTQKLCVFDRDGNLRSGFPATVQDQMWSSVAVGDLDGDGSKEMAFASRSDLPSGGRAMYVFRAGGAEWMDGDANPATLGVFRVMGQNFNHGTPAIADLDGDGLKEIVYGSFDGNLYAWSPNGSNLPGFPVNLQAPISASVAIGRLDGPSGPFSIVVPAANDSIYVIAANGSRRTNFPRWIRTTGTNRSPSPALADMDADGVLDIVYTSTNGGVSVIGANGFFHPLWSGVRYSALTAYASECSPVVADINGDGRHDIVVGDEDGMLAGLSGLDGTMLPGFPIRLGAEATGTSALCDCDGDGLSEIVTADYGRSLFMWDYDFPFSPTGPPPWPQFHHDAERTGNASTPILLDAGGGATAAPRALELAAPWPNPARGPLRLAFGVPAGDAGAAYEVAIYDLAGRRVRMLERGAARAGRHAAAWDLRDERGGVAASGVYFARLAVGPHAALRKVVVVR